MRTALGRGGLYSCGEPLLALGEGGSARGSSSTLGARFYRWPASPLLASLHAPIAAPPPHPCDCACCLCPLRLSRRMAAHASLDQIRRR